MKQVSTPGPSSVSSEQELDAKGLVPGDSLSSKRGLPAMKFPILPFVYIRVTFQGF